MKNILQLITTCLTLSFVLVYPAQQPFAKSSLSPGVSIYVVSDSVGWKDIIFTEIFPDPSPSVGLPAAEFVELLNRSPAEISLNGWQVRDASSVMTLPDIRLRPGEYLILTGAPEHYESFGRVWGSHDFPSLNNAGDILTLQTAQGGYIDSVHYTDGWYKDTERKNGGWSLELIDPENLCSDQSNWIVSNDPAGGTAGKQNNMYSEKPDLSGPELMSVIASDNNTLQLEFNERLSDVVPDAGSFHVDPYVQIKTIEFMEASLKELTLSLTEPIRDGVSYSLTLSDIYDCAGNAVNPDFSNSIFGKTEDAVAGDVVINEILFNPGPTAVDFIEVRNRTDKFINISHWSLSNYDESVLDEMALITDKNFVLQPYGYLAFAEDKDLLLSAYSKASADAIFQVAKLPPLNDDAGTAAISNKHGEIIDHMRYSANMHTVFIRDPEGVSLERTSADILSNDIRNWKSASENSGFGTPGYLNSNDLPLSSLTAEAIKIDPQAFIPGSGQADFARIHYSFDQGGYVANVRIYDSKGRVIKEIANNEILGTEGALRWDGDTESGRKARTGSYMIWFEIFDASGQVRIIRKGVAVGSRF